MDVDPVLLELLPALLGTSFISMYAYGAASPDGRATLLLVVTARDLLRNTKLGLAQTCLRHSSETAPPQLLVVRVADLQAEQPAILVQFQFSEADRETLTATVTGLDWLQWQSVPCGSVDRAPFLMRLPLAELVQAPAGADTAARTLLPREPASPPVPVCVGRRDGRDELRAAHAPP